ncbi:MAG: ABC transporter ATP-binding protein [Nanoarchaeota archaeon]|nr:ABC transporter ATP-binding protein [Nanoarchaeota archaeon]MBU1632780.1 ABC transporter ATP-binding protein [Nanoarchaeota archaeon]MBU1876533.1 ABC transporter ATP-binding protein [Nanoarchaeota archaeon]
MANKSSSRETVIQLKNVHKTYHIGEVSLEVLKGINLEVKKGEFVVIVGPSGSGKSTLMNQVGILDIPTNGSILLGGQDISKLSESDLAQLRGRKIGFIFQQFNLISTLTALENVILPTIFQNMSVEERTAKSENLLKQVGLGDRMNHRPNELSGGQQQRVAIARALINNPEIVLADEPTGNLDSKSGQQVMDLLAKLHTQEKKTIILITHDIELVRYAQKIVHIKDGEIVKIKHNHHKS